MKSGSAGFLFDPVNGAPFGGDYYPWGRRVTRLRGNRARSNGAAVEISGYNAAGKWYTDASGIMRYAAIGAPYVDHVWSGTAWVAKGVRWEQAATNLLLYSEQFDNAIWVKSASGTGVVPTVTANYGVAPDGTTTAERVQLGSGDAGASQVAQTTGLSTTAQHVYSVWVRSLSGSVTVTLFLLSAVKNIAVTGEWQRFDYAVTPGSSTVLEVRIAKRDVWGSTGTADLLVWGAQLETGAIPSSYIPTTTTTVTRAKDTASIPEPITPYKAAGFLEYKYTPDAATSTTERMFGDCLSGTDGFQFYIATDGKLSARWYSATVNLASAVLTWSVGTEYTLRIAWSGTTITLYRDGVSVATGTLTALATIPATLYLGQDSAGAKQANGRVSLIRTRGL